MSSSPNYARPVVAGDHVVLVDGSGYIFRAYHALPPLTRPSDGLPVGAVHGFAAMLWKLLRDKTDDVPDATHLAVIFDRSEHTFRNAIYDRYKAHRPEAPDDLKPQFPLIRDTVRAFSVISIEQDGFEADDLIATYAREAAEAGASVTVISSDKDLMQLVRPGVSMFDSMKNKLIGEAEVFEKFGVGPDKVVEVQALIGDTTDNVPGVPGIGVKTAAELIGTYGDLETLLARAGEIKQAKRRENLTLFADQARLSRRLVLLDDRVAVETPLADSAVRQPDPEPLLAFLKTMEFATLSKRIAQGLGMDAPFEPPRSMQGRPPPGAPTRARGAPMPASASSPAALAENRAAEIAAVPFDASAYQTITDTETLAAWLLEAQAQGLIALKVKMAGSDPMQGDIAGLALALAPGRAAYVPLRHAHGDGLDLAGAGAVTQIGTRAALDLLAPVLEDASVAKVVTNAKHDMIALARHGIALGPADDPCLISYALDAGKHDHDPAGLSERLLGYLCRPLKEVTGTGKAAVTFDRAPLAAAAMFAAEQADAALRLYLALKPRLPAERVTTVYETLERPLIHALAGMERAGVKVDRGELARLSSAFAQKIARLEREIAGLAGEPFNIGSPKQLGEILFDRMGITGGRKTKTGAWSTDAGVLEELVVQGHALPKLVLEWRQVSKLKTTYTDALPLFINPDTGRIHTSYALAATTTGRLSSADPNLQNIPVRTDEGRAIRKAFIADEGKRLISADYSQIELRVLAHMAEIPALAAAFAEGLDIHAMTASEMFGVPIQGMSAAIRRRAKAINFGIIYGISSFGLAAQLGISRGEAGDYIKTYFERFPGIRDYMEQAKADCRRQGYVKTLFGRKIHYPDINIRNPGLRGNYERAAINAPIQGTAADIIRRAMVRMPGALKDAGLSARMLLQVHDELVFEAPEAEVEATIGLARAVMEASPEPALKLRVPLQVDAKAARDWEAAH